MNTDNIINSINDVFESGSRKEHLLQFLNKVKVGLDEAPASSSHQYHHAYRGGLAAHIIEVYGVLKALGDGLVEHSLCYTNSDNKLTEEFTMGEDSYSMLHCLTNDSYLMVSILHDIHKVCDSQDQVQYEPNILKSGSQSDKVPYKLNKECYSYNCLSPEDHEQHEPLRSLAWLFQNKKVEIKNGGVRSLALIAAKHPALIDELTPYEMDAIEFHGGAYETSKFTLAGKENPLMLLMHCADMLSSRFGKTRKI